MTTHKDSKGHIYADVENIRVTYIPAKDRDASKDCAVPVSVLAGDAGVMPVSVLTIYTFSA